MCIFFFFGGGGGGVACCFNKMSQKYSKLAKLFKSFWQGSVRLGFSMCLSPLGAHLVVGFVGEIKWIRKNVTQFLVFMVGGFKLTIFLRTKSLTV